MGDVVLIQLPIQKYNQKNFQTQNEFNPALGILSIATFLQFNGRKVEIIDLFHEPATKQDFVDRIKQENPKLVGIQVYSENIQMAINFARLIKEISSSVKVFLGGPHVSLDDTEFMENDCIDFIVINEGEATVVELTEAVLSDEKIIKFSDIKGMKYRKDGIVYENEKKDFLKDLDLLPIPKREFFELENYKDNSFINFYTSRGCPSKCIYCAATFLSGGKYRVRGIENVFLEMRMIEHLIGVKCFGIIDDSFTILKDRLGRFMELYKTHNAKFFWNCESRINNMKEEILKEMAACNCVGIQYGIESGNQEVLNKIHKNINLDDAREVIDATVRNGIIAVVGFILGHYCDTNETMEETINMIKELRARHGGDMEIALSYNTPFPGTYQFINRDRLGIKLVTNDYKRFSMTEPIVNTDQFTIDDQRNWMYEARPYIFRKIDIITKYNRN